MAECRVPLPRRTILIAEDYKPFRDFVFQELEHRRDVQVACVADGAAAVRAAAEMQPDLALLDIGLPALNGIAAARQIRAISPKSQIVFVSQEQAPDVVAAALGVGARGYIVKVRSQGYLRAMVDAVLDDASLDDEQRQAAVGGDAGAGRGHSVQFCADDAVLLNTVERIVFQTLERGEAAIAVLTRSHRAALDARLARRRTILAEAMTLGTLVMIDVDDLVATMGDYGEADWGRVFDDFAATVTAAGAATGHPQPRVAIVGEIAPVLLAAGHTDAAVRMERIGHDLVMSPALPATHLTCIYPSQPPPAAALLAGICATHSTVTVC